MSRIRLEVLLESIDQAYERRTWHGTTLRGALRGVDAETAAWHPGSGRPSIWEITVHLAYWKRIVLHRITDREPAPFPHAGSDWFERPRGAPDGREWKEDLDLLARIHRDLRNAADALTDDDLRRVPRRSQTVEDLLRGAAFHDVHHGGQIQALKRLYAQKPA